MKKQILTIGLLLSGAAQAVNWENIAPSKTTLAAGFTVGIVGAYGGYKLLKIFKNNNADSATPTTSNNSTGQPFTNTNNNVLDNNNGCSSGEE